MKFLNKRKKAVKKPTIEIAMREGKMYPVCENAKRFHALSDGDLTDSKLKVIESLGWQVYPLRAAIIDRPI